MLNNPIDLTIIVVLIAIVFGPKSNSFPPWKSKPETNEKPVDRKRDPFQQEKTESFYK